MSSKESFGKKSFRFFVGYKDDEKVKQLCKVPPKLSEYSKVFIKTKHMYFLIKDNE